MYLFSIHIYYLLFLFTTFIFEYVKKYFHTIFHEFGTLRFLKLLFFYFVTYALGA